MVRKKDLKQRAIYVYPPSRDMTERWKERAEKSKLSISKFVIEHVENSLNQDDAHTSRAVLIEEISQLRETLGEKEKRIDHLELLVERLEEDLRLYRSKMFTDEEFTGVRSYDRKLIEILREPGVHSSEELLSRLRIKQDELEAIKAVSVQLENLQTYGLVKSTSRGWMWIK